MQIFFAIGGVAGVLGAIIIGGFLSGGKGEN